MRQRQEPLDAEHFRSMVAEGLAGQKAASTTERPGAVGLEVEFFPVQADGARLDSEGLTSLLDSFHGAHREIRPDDKDSLVWQTESGARLMPEPGAQLEYAGPPCADVGTARRDLAGTIHRLTAHAAAYGVSLLSAGIDPLGQHARQSLPGPRYPAMHAYFGQRSPTATR